MDKFILENKQENIHIEGDFDSLKNCLSDLTEMDSKISDEKWEAINLLNAKDLPFKAGSWRLRRDDLAE